MASVSWTANSDGAAPEGFYVEVAGPEGFAKTVAVPAPATGTEVAGLKNGVEYSFRVTTATRDGSAAASNWVTATPSTGMEGVVAGVIVEFEPGSEKAKGEQDVPGEDRVEGVDLTVGDKVADDAVLVELSEPVDVDTATRIADDLEADPEISWAEPDQFFFTSNEADTGVQGPGLAQPVSVPADSDYAASQWNLWDTYGISVGDGTEAMTDAWAGATGDGINVAVIDTGITAHPDLDSQLVPGFDFVSNPEKLAAVRQANAPPVAFDGDYVDQATYGALGRDANPADPGDWRGVTPVRDSSWHGTQMAGIIAAANNVDGITGIAPNAKIQPIRALSWRGGLLSDIAAGITWASGGQIDGVPSNENPSKVINMSFAVETICPVALQDAIDGARDRGAILIAAAGNASDDAAKFAPGNCDGVITVAASNRDGQRADYSNYGPTIDIAAPGGDSSSPITTTSNTGTQTPDQPSTGSDFGTSAAAAHVSAAAAILASRNASLTPDQAYEQLTGNEFTKAFANETCDAANPDYSCGTGILTLAQIQTVASGDQDYAMTFTRTGDNAGTYATAPSSAFSSVTGNVTFEAWAKPGNLASGRAQGIVALGTSGIWTDNASNWVARIEANSEWTDVTIAPIVTGEWVHLAMTWNSSTGAITTYINGQQSATGTRVGTLNVDNELLVGKYEGWDPFGGVIDEVRIWNTVRTEEQIQADMRTYGPILTDGSATPGLVAYYDFNEGPAGTTGTGTVYNRADSPAAGSNLRTVDGPTYTDVKQTTSNGNNTVVTFPRSYLTAAGGWRVPEGVSSVDALVIGGGGGGGAGSSSSKNAGGGGGGGGFISDSPQVSGVLGVTVGTGGQGGVGCTTGTCTGGSAGSASSVTASDSSVIAEAGGGLGGGRGQYSVGGLGGLGGGSGSPQSNAGVEQGPDGGGGGSAPDGIGTRGSTSGGGAGADGRASTITGSEIRYGAGGGGGGGDSSNVAGAGGSGGGGRGGTTSVAPVAGTAGLGGGGGGGAYATNNSGAAGGSGVVIVSYSTVNPSCEPFESSYIDDGTVYRVLKWSDPDQTGCTWTVPAGLSTFDYLVVGGGGAGGSAGVDTSSGGGGGGRVLAGTVTSPNSTYAVTVGGGGQPQEVPTSSGAPGAGGDGEPSGLGGISALGGGGGASAYVLAGNQGPASTTGWTGGGGSVHAAHIANGSTGTGGSGFRGGNPYGDGTNASPQAAGGGGGSAGAGSNATSGQGGNGGAGTSSDITGMATAYGGGGGGGKRIASGSAGSGSDGGGNGGLASVGGYGQLGGGGGGAGNDNLGGEGGDGVVIVRYAVTDSDACVPFEYPSGSYTVVEFQGAGECDWTVPAGVTRVDVLTVGGGGGGGGGSQSSDQSTANSGGGGGGGQVQFVTDLSVSGTVGVTVGAGGSGGDAATSGQFDAVAGSAGESSEFGDSTVALGGGGGGVGTAQSLTEMSGDGGGSSRTIDGTGITTSGGASSWDGAGGGAGAGADGSGGEDIPGLGGIGGDGGLGYRSSITGASVVYGGGGGGGGTWDGTGSARSDGSGGAGGDGGGGAGSQLPDSPASQGTDGLGGGGGGAGRTDGTASVVGGDGGDGVVIVRYSTNWLSLSVGGGQQPSGYTYSPAVADWDSAAPKVQLIDAAGTALSTPDVEVTASFTASSGSATLSGATAATDANGVADFSSLVLDGDAETAGTLTFSATGYGSVASSTVTIGKAPLTVTADDQSVSYGTAASTVTDAGSVTYSGFVNSETIAVVSGSLSYTTTYTSSTDAGTSGVVVTPVVSGLSATNYSFTAATGTVTITKISQSALTLTSTSGTYGTAISLATSGGTTAGSVTYAVVNGTATNCAESGGSLTSSTAGTCTVTATMAGNTNYNPVSSSATTVTFGAKALTMTGVTAANKVYDGNTSATLDFSSASLVGVVSGDTSSEIDFDSSSATGTFASAAVADGVAVTVSGVTLTGTKASSYTLTQPTGVTANIEPATRTLSFSTTSYSKTYGDAAFTVTATPSAGAGTITYSVTGSGCTVNASTGEVTILRVGSCAISASIATDGTYDPASTTTSATVTVNAKAVTISGMSASDKVFDDSDAATITSWGSLQGLVSGDTVTIDSTSASATFASPNVGQGITVTASGVGLSGTDASNYTLSAQPTASADITARSLTITATDQAITYGDSTPAPAFTSSGLQGDDAIGSVTFAYSGANNPNAPTAGGSYTITPSAAVFSSGSLSNYSPTYVAGSYTVGKKALTVTASDEVATYGGAAPTITASYSGFITGDSTSDLTTVPTCSSTYTGTTPVTSSPVSSCSGGVSGNYNFTYVDGTVTINKAPLTVTASSSSVIYGADVPEISPSYSGFVNSQTPSVLSTAPSCTTAYTTTSAAGTTPSTSCSGAAATNYSFTYVNGSVTIAQATPTLSWSDVSKTYGDGPYTIAAPSASGVTGSALAGSFSYASSDTSVISISGATATVAGAGSATITATFTPTDTTNYESGETTTSIVTVGKGLQSALSITSTSGTFGSALSLTATGGSTAGAVTFVASNGTASGCSVTGSSLTVSSAGTCTVTATMAGDDDYEAVDSAATTVTFGKASQTITFANPASSGATYGDAAIPVAPTSSSGLSVTLTPTDSSICTVSGGGVNLVSAGTCEITASQAGNGNYLAASDVVRSFTIAKADQATLSMTSSSSAIYGETITLAASGGSGTGALTFSASDGSATGCSVSGSTLSYSTAGTCLVTARRASDTNYTQVSSGQQTLTIAKAGQTLAFTSSVPTSPVSGNTYTPTASAVSAVTGLSSGVTPSFAVSGTCSLSAGVVTFTASGNCVITASATGNTNFTAASDVTQTIAVGSINQNITFAQPSNKTYGSSSFALGATASSGLTVTYTLGVGTTNSACTVSALGVVTLLDVGACEVVAAQSGDSQYAAASSVTRAFQIFSALPTAPSLTSASASSQAITIGFSVPGFTGAPSVSISGYQVVATPTGGGTTVTSTACASSPCTISGLTNGTEYTVTVAAINVAGTGPASGASTALTPATAAYAVSALAATPGDTTVVLSWTALTSAQLGGGTFSRYEISQREAGTSAWTLVTSALTTQSTSSYTVTGLDNGTSYDFQVVAITSANSSEIAGNTAQVVQYPSTVPSVPLSPVVLASTATDVQFSWAAPLSDGGSALTTPNYSVTVTGSSGAASVTCTPGNTATFCTASNLTNGARYVFSVVANNRMGSSVAATTTYNVPSSDASLSDLVVTGPGGSVSLTPSFASGTTDYTASVTNAVSAVTVTPTTTSAGASVTVDGVSVTSASASSSIALAVGSNEIEVVVTASDPRFTETYTVTITRAADPTPVPTPEPAPSNGGSTPTDPVTPPAPVMEGQVLAVVTEGDSVVPVVLQPTSADDGWEAVGSGFDMVVRTEEPDGAPVPLAADRRLAVPQGGRVQVAGDGYQSESVVRVFMVPRTTTRSGLMPRAVTGAMFLGETTVNAAGDFAATFTVPANVNIGDYVLQINGVSASALVRSVNMGLEVIPGKAAMRVGMVQRAGFYQGFSDQFSDLGKSKLQQLVRSVPKDAQAVQVEVAGVSVGLDSLKANAVLAAERASKLAEELEKRGIQGEFTVTVTASYTADGAERSVSGKADVLTTKTGKPLSTVTILFQEPATP